MFISVTSLCTHQRVLLGGPWRWLVAAGLQTSSSRKSSLERASDAAEPAAAGPAAAGPARLTPTQRSVVGRRGVRKHGGARRSSMGADHPALRILEPDE